MSSTQNLATEDTFKDEIRRLKQQLAEEKAETERTRIQRATARQQAAEFQQMFHLAIKEKETWQQRVAEMGRAIAPLAAWAAATLQAKRADQDGFMPGEAVVGAVNDVKLTVNDLRALIEVAEGSGDDGG